MYKKASFLLLILLLVLSACGGQNQPLEESPSPGGEPGLDIATAPPADTENQEPATLPADAPPAEPVKDPKTETVEAMLASMSLEEKIGQMFFVRCPPAGAAEDVTAYHLGGFILFGQDFKNSDGEWLTREQFTDTVAKYQAAAKIPLLIGVDEEGGTVARASRNPNLFLEKRKSPQTVYAQGGPDAVTEDTLLYSNGLLALGINVNLAPVADVSTNPADFIYDRSLGQDAAATAEYVKTAVTAVSQVQYTAGDGRTLHIGAVLKHFPGYGDNVDTHTGVALDQRSYEQFESEDFLPFRSGIDAGAGGVLVSHNVVTCMDPDFPASLSPEVHRVLREELGFSGVVMTDDLAMDAVEAYAEDGSVAVLAVLAGNDLIVTTDYQTQIPLVIDAVRTGLVSEVLVDQAVTRVLGWKYDLGLLEDIS